MIIRWTWLLLGLAFLAPPPVLSSDLKRVIVSVRRNAILKVASLVRSWQNWVDLVCSYLGALVITELAFQPDPSKNSGPKALLL